jgi:dihydrofolate reductase
MGRVMFIGFTTLDGVVQDPDGGDGSERGGWAFRYGPEAVAGDKFELGDIMQTGALLLGRVTWKKFSQLWPTRDDEFSTRMNRMSKLVASHSLESVDAWENSDLLEGDLVEEVTRRKADQDIVVTGSASVVRLLQGHDLIDEYRLLVFPTVVGDGRRLFEHPSESINLRLEKAEPVGAALRLVYTCNTHS